MNKEYAIGVRFSYRGKTYEAVENKHKRKCAFCAFRSDLTACPSYPCFDKDGKSIVFKETSANVEDYEKYALQTAIELSKECYPETKYGNEIREAFVEGYLKNIISEKEKWYKTTKGISENWHSVS